MTTITFRIHGLDSALLDQVRADGIDMAGNPVEPFIDTDGGWPLRCCLTDSRPGDRLAIVAWSPFPWRGAYAETGPVVIHTDQCAPPTADHELPVQFRNRRQILRPYGHDRRIAYEHIRTVDESEDLAAAIGDLLSVPEIDFIHARNAKANCYSFTATRS